MAAPTRLVLYAAALLFVFTTAYVVAGAIVPEETVDNWVSETDNSDDSNDNDSNGGGHGHQ